METDATTFAHTSQGMLSARARMEVVSSCAVADRVLIRASQRDFALDDVLTEYTEWPFILNWDSGRAAYGAIRES